MVDRWSDWPSSARLEVIEATLQRCESRRTELIGMINFNLEDDSHDDQRRKLNRAFVKLGCDITTLHMLRGDVNRSDSRKAKALAKANIS